MRLMQKIKHVFESILYLVIIILVWEIVYYGYSLIISKLFDIGIISGSSIEGGTTQEKALSFIRQTEYIYVLIGWIIGTSIIIMVLKKTKRLPLLKEKRRLRFANICMSVIVGLGMVFLVNGFISIINEYYTLNSFFISFDSMNSFSSIQRLMLIGVLLPVFEEFVFRGLIMSRLLETKSEALAIVVQALLFAVCHFGIIQGSYALFLGVLAGISVIKTRTIGSALVIHIIFNISNLYLYSTGIDSYDMGQLTIYIALGIILIYFAMNKLQKDKIVYKT